MRKSLLLILLVIVISLVSFAALAYWTSPTVASVSPLENAEGVAAGTQVTITFSRSMQADTVTDRLVFSPHRSGTYHWQENTLIFTPEQPWPNGEQVTVQLEAGAKTEGLLSFPIWQPYSWTFYTGVPRLVYLYPADGPANIYLLDLMTGESEQLTNFPSGILSYDVNPGGNWFYYSRKNGQSNSSIFGIRLTDQTGNQPVEIVKCLQATCSAISVSPNGNYLAYEKTAAPGSSEVTYPQVWIVPLRKDAELNKGEASLIEPYKAGETLHQTIQPHWSPDEMLTFYDTNQSAFVIFDPDRGEQFLIPNQTGQPGSWHPSAEAYVAAEIFFVDTDNLEDNLDIELIGSSHLLQFNLEDKTFNDLTKMDNLEDTTPVYSPDGSRLAFARKYLTVERWTPGRQLWVMNSDGRQVEQLSNDPLYNHFNIVWSPSGDSLAFVRFNQTLPIEPPQIWVIDLKNKVAKQLVEGGYAPKWIP